MKTIKNTIIPNIIKERKKKGFTQKEMADFLGISLSGYRKIEQGQRQLKMDQAKQISYILDVPLPTLMQTRVDTTDILNQTSLIRKKFLIELLKTFGIMKSNDSDYTVKEITIILKFLEKNNLQSSVELNRQIKQKKKTIEMMNNKIKEKELILETTKNATQKTLSVFKSTLSNNKEELTEDVSETFDKEISEMDDIYDRHYNRLTSRIEELENELEKYKTDYNGLSSDDVSNISFLLIKYAVAFKYLTAKYKTSKKQVDDYCINFINDLAYLSNDEYKQLTTEKFLEEFVEQYSQDISFS